MTVHRRSLLLSAATAFLFPACISISAKPMPITPSELAARITAEGADRATEAVRKNNTDFAIYPSRPGEMVPTKPVQKDATVVQKPTPGPIPPLPPGPVVPPNPFVPASGSSNNARDPGVFPL